MAEVRSMKYFIVGYMASGKSTFGKELAKDKGLPFLDLDESIEAREGRSISEIFAKEGEVYFREREREMFFDGERYYDIVRNGYYTLPGMISEVFEQLTEQDVKDGALYVPIMDTEMQRNTLMRQNPYWLARW